MDGTYGRFVTAFTVQQNLGLGSDFSLLRRSLSPSLCACVCVCFVVRNVVCTTTIELSLQRKWTALFVTLEHGDKRKNSLLSVTQLN